MLCLGTETSVVVVIQEPLTDKRTCILMYAGQRRGRLKTQGREAEEGGPLQRPQEFCFHRSRPSKPGPNL